MHLLHDGVGDLNLNGSGVWDADVVCQRCKNDRLAIIAVPTGLRVTAARIPMPSRRDNFKVDRVDRIPVGVRQRYEVACLIVRYLDYLKPRLAITDGRE